MPVTLNDDRVWFDENRKVEQICDQVSTARENGHSVLLLSHFESTLARLAPLLGEKGISLERFSSLNPAELCGASGRVWFGLARNFQVTYETSLPTEGAALEIVVAEHHPMQSRDQEIVEAAAKLACNAELCFHFSLDDPVMKHFGADPIKALFERLGIDKNECITHPFINTAIRNAQEKIESQVGRDLTTQSAEDWFKYNLPEKK